MTIDEAILNIKTHIGWASRVLDGPLGKEFIKSVKELVHREIKYGWHDLRKDPTDLPDDTKVNDNFMVAVIVEDIYPDHIGETMYLTSLYWGNKKWEASIVGDVVAWREIEPYAGDSGC